MKLRFLLALLALTSPASAQTLPTPNLGTGTKLNGAVVTTTATKSQGTSVADPGTGALEALLPVQTFSAANHSFVASDLYKETRRSNAGSAMSDTFPPSTAVGLANGTRMFVNNVDTSASLTITAGAGTTINSGTSVVVGPGRSSLWVYDLLNTNWRPTGNSLTALLAANSLSDVGSAATARGNLGLGSIALLNTIANSNMAAMAANTIKANPSGASAAPSDIALPSCSDSTGNHLNYVAGTGFVCGASVSSDGAWTAYTPTATYGTFTTNPTITALSARYKAINSQSSTKTYSVVTAFQVTTVGSGSGTIIFSLPLSLLASGAISTPCSGFNLSTTAPVPAYLPQGGSGVQFGLFTPGASQYYAIHCGPFEVQ